MGDAGGGQYHVNYHHVLTCLLESHVEAVLQERFSSKAARVFKYIHTQKYVEESDLQGQVERFLYILVQ